MKNFDLSKVLSEIVDHYKDTNENKAKFLDETSVIINGLPERIGCSANLLDSRKHFEAVGTVELAGKKMA